MKPQGICSQLLVTRRYPMENDNETIGGYAVPVDPMDLLQCDSCQ
jgi:hypothetical protein